MKGTLYYAVIILVVTLLWFYIPANGVSYANPTALIIIGCLAGGDGLADMVGRRFGKHKYHISGSEKSIEGSFGMFLGSVIFSFVLLTIFSLEVSQWNMANFVMPILIFAFIAMIIEGISPKNLDNWTITIAVVVMIVLAYAISPDFWQYPLFGGAILG